MGKYTSPAVNGNDLIHALKAIKKDTSCETRVEISLNQQGELAILVKTYTCNNGVPLGIAKEGITWVDGNGQLLARLMLAVHRVYHKSEDMAHRGFTSK